MPRKTPPPVLLRAARLLDVDAGRYVEPGTVVVEEGRIAEVGTTRVPDGVEVRELGEVTLLPGLMDMEVNLLMGGPDHQSPLVAVQDDPAVKTLRGVANARRTLRAGFTTVRNLGLFVQTGGILLDVALKKAIDLGWVDGRSRVLGNPGGRTPGRLVRAGLVLTGRHGPAAVLSAKRRVAHKARHAADQLPHLLLALLEKVEKLRRTLAGIAPNHHVHDASLSWPRRRFDHTPRDQGFKIARSPRDWSLFS